MPELPDFLVEVKQFAPGVPTKKDEEEIPYFCYTLATKSSALFHGRCLRYAEAGAVVRFDIGGARRIEVGPDSKHCLTKKRLHVLRNREGTLLHTYAPLTDNVEATYDWTAWDPGVSELDGRLRAERERSAKADTWFDETQS